MVRDNERVPSPATRLWQEVSCLLELGAEVRLLV